MTKRTRTAMLIVLLGVIVPPVLHAQWIQEYSTIKGGIGGFVQEAAGIYAGGISGGIFRKSVNDSSWISVSQAPIESVAAMAVQGPSLFAASSARGLYRSTNNGIGWARLEGELTKVAPWSFLSVTTIGGVLYAGSAGGGAFRSTDNGNSWKQVNNGIPGRNVHCFQLHGNYIYAGTNSGVYRTGDRGDNWTQLNVLKDRTVLSLIEVNGVLYAGTDMGMIRFSQDDNSVTLMLETPGVVAFATDGEDIFAATHGYGVFWLRHGGTTWIPINDGLNDLRVTTLAYINGMLYAGADGGGVWKRPLPTDPLRSVPMSIALQSGSLRIHPNPVSEDPALGYTLNMPSSVTVTLYDAVGSVVSRPVVDAMQEQGNHKLVLDTDALAAGSYLCSVNAGGVEHFVRFVVMR